MREYLARGPRLTPRILVLGLCGSLTPQWGWGTTVVYQDCLDGSGRLSCDPTITNVLQACLGAPLVTGFSTSHVVSSAQAKGDLGREWGAGVVDMEGTAILGSLSGYQVGMVRVVSDAVTQELPDLSGVFDAQGRLQPLRLARSLGGQPVAALDLIRGSLGALRSLGAVAAQLTQAL